MSTEQQEMGVEVATVEERAVARQEGATPGEGLTLIERALDRGVDMETIERLVALQERKEARDAERAMTRALAAFQAECPPIPRRGEGKVMKNGQFQYSYTFAKYDDIAPIIRPFLEKHGLSYTHDSTQGNNEIEVTCTLRHTAGAKRTSTFRGPFDNSGGKNALQAVGSSRSYGKRYTLTDVLGLSAEEDDDGEGSHGQEVQTISEQQLATLNRLAGEADADIKAFCEFMAVDNMAAIPARQFRFAENVLKEKIERAKKDGAE